MNSLYKVETTWNRKPDLENIYLDTNYMLIGAKIAHLRNFLGFGEMATNS